MAPPKRGDIYTRKPWGPLELRLRPASLADLPCIYVDAFSVAAALRRPEELFRSLAEFPGEAVAVLDASAEVHLPTARRYLELCRRYMVDCRLAERRPAEEEAVELACRRCGGGTAGVGGGGEGKEAGEEGEVGRSWMGEDGCPCAVVTRDADALRRRAELGCRAPVLLFRGGRLWLAEEATPEAPPRPPPQIRPPRGRSRSRRP